MNKKSKKNLAKVATVAVAMLTAFGCFVAGCKTKSSPPEQKPDPKPPVIEPDPEPGLVPDEDEVATSTSIVNKTPVSEATIYYIGTPADGATADGTSAETPMSVDEFTRTVINGVGLKPGNIVRVMPGEHMVKDRIIMDDVRSGGTYDDYVIWEAVDPAQKTVLNFKQQLFDSLNRGVQIYCNYVYWSNIDICGAGDNGLYIGGSYNIIESCEFYMNRDTGLQLGRSSGEYGLLDQWPSYNLIKNCTSYNNYDNETYGENADGFAAKLTVGHGNIFDGCIAYRNSDDGWDLFGKPDSGNIGRVLLYNCVAFENGFIMQTQEEYNKWFGEAFNVGLHPTDPNLEPVDLRESNTAQFVTRDGDGNGFKLGGSTMAGDVYLENCLSFNNRMHGVTDNSNPGIIRLNGVTSYNNAAGIDTRSHLNIVDENGQTNVLYHSISTDGYIFNASGKAVVVDSETKTAKADYVALDKEGYILNGDSKFVLDEGGQQVKGENILAKGTTIIVDKLTKESNEKYVGLDAEGYITDSNGNFVLDSKDQKIKGIRVVDELQDQTVNPTFGHISGGHVESCNNIDLARTGDSYNTLKNVLSVNGGGRSLGADKYKGAVERSVFSLNLTKSVKFNENKDTAYISVSQDAIDDGYIAEIGGEEVVALSAAAVFEALPSDSLGMSTEIDKLYRNDDGSINMGNILKIKDYSGLFGDTNKIGSDLTKTSWGDYNHYDYVYLTDDTVTTNTDARLTAVKDLLYVPVDENACYQDFSIVSRMNSCTIEWKSSNPEVLSIGTREYSTSSGGRSVRVVVNRVKGSDTKVTLTALIIAPNKKQAKQKTFEINVKAYEGRLGDIIVDGATEDGYVILYQNEGEEPTFKITNAADYNGKLLDESDYTVSKTEVYYARSKTEEMSKVSKFRISTAGVYEIRKTLTIGSVSREYRYTVYVVSKGGDIDFVGADGGTIAATHNGYRISGELSNVAGTLYTMVSDTKPTAEQLKSQGEAFEITKDSLNVSFEHDISQGFTVYYGLYNPNGELKSEIYERNIEIVNISSKDDFKALATGGGDASKIYHLTSNLEFSSADGWTVGTEGFKGVLDGQGYTISGINVINTSEKGKASVFFRLDGGSIMNVNFENISLEGSQDVGIIGQAYSGYLSHIRMKNIRSVGVQRIGGLVGHVYEQSGEPLIVENVSLINTSSEARIYGTTSRAGGILGFIQTNAGDSLKSHIVDVRVSNCYVNAEIGNTAAEQFGGIVGTYDTSSQATTVTYSLTIDSCVFVGTVRASKRAGGIIGYQQGVQKLRINNCVSFGDIYHAGSVEPIVVAEKNASGIFGGYSGTADTLVTACYAKFEEHNGNYEVSIATEANMKSETFWKVYTKFDFTNVWELVPEENSETPYIKLK